VFKKDLLLNSSDVEIEKENGTADVSLSVTKETKGDGVLRVTVENLDTATAIAERLVFRRPNATVSLKVTSNYKTYCPGDTATITVQAKDCEGKPVVTPVILSITDESVLETVEKRKQAPRIPEMIYLEDEVAHLEDCQVYLSENSKSDVAVDLLLGTQGWRRFVFDDTQKKLDSDKQEKLHRISVTNDTAYQLYDFDPEKIKEIYEPRNEMLLDDIALENKALDDSIFTSSSKETSISLISPQKNRKSKMAVNKMSEREHSSFVMSAPEPKSQILGDKKEKNQSIEMNEIETKTSSTGKKKKKKKTKKTKTTKSTKNTTKSKNVCFQKK